MEWKTRRINTFMNERRPLFYCISVFSAFVLLTTLTTKSISPPRPLPPCLDIKCPKTGEADNFNIQGFEMVIEKMKGEERKVSFSLARVRRFLSGPGSSPPRCMSKCGRCTPCKPVHVPVPPGTPVTAEYYPEAWRCKCGNKLYMP